MQKKTNSDKKENYKTMRQYSIHTVRQQGKLYNAIKFWKGGVRIFNVSWLPDNKEAEAKAIRSADLCVIKHGLNYKTRKLKPVK